MRLIVLLFGGLLAVPGIAAAQSFAPLTGASGCVVAEGAETDSESGTAQCAKVKALGSVNTIAVSPDDKNVYVASSTAILSFSRAADTGALTSVGCVSDTGDDGRPGTDGACTDGDALNGLRDLVVSPDGRFVYATAQYSNSLVWLTRDPATGALTPAGCLKAAPREDHCGSSLGLMSPGGLAITDDGKSIYVVSSFDSSITAFTRDVEKGSLTGGSCVSDSGSDGRCVNGNALAGVSALALAPDGASAFAIGPSALSSYTRDAGTGALTPRACALGSGLAGSSCVTSPPLADVRDLVVAPNGQVIVAASSDSAVAVLNGGDLSPASCVVHSDPTAEDYESDEEDEADEEEEDTADDEDSGDDEEEEEEEEDEEPANPNVAKCAPAKAISGVSGLALSRDGKSLFTNSGGYVSAFNRDTNTGTLTEFACLETYPYYKSCGEAKSYSFGAIATTSDGRNLYAGTYAGLAVLSSAVAVTNRTARMSRDGRIALRLACPAQRARSCRGSVAGARYRLARGTAASVKVRLPSGVRRSVRRHHRLAVAFKARDADRTVRAAGRKVLVSAR